MKQAEDKINQKGGEDPWEKYRAQAEILKQQAQAAGHADADEEEKKGDDDAQPAAGAQEVNLIQKTVDDAMAAEAWLKPERIEKFKEAMKGNTKVMKPVVEIMGQLFFNKEMVDLVEIFDSEEEYLMAVQYQNMFHPQNKNRTEAIKEGKYVFIDSKEKAHEYLLEQTKINMGTVALGVKSDVTSQLNKLQSSADLKIMIDSPDIFICTAAMNSIDFYEGRGDRTQFFEMILNLNPLQIPDLARKLKLVTQREYMGLKLYNDSMSKPDRVNK